MNTQFAQTTTVPVVKTRAEIEDTLGRYGADSFAVGMEPGRAMLMFRIKGSTGRNVAVRMILPLPEITEKQFQRRPWRNTSKTCTPEESRALWEQACRSRWRCLLLVVKAKLEAVACGISTIEREFLADIMTPNGLTVGEQVIGQIEALPAGGRLLLGMGGES